MKNLCLFCLSLCMASTLPAETRIGVIGLDTSHAIEFTKLINVTRNDPIFKDFRVTVAYPYGSLDIFSSTNRYPQYIPQMKSMGVKIVDSEAGLLAQSDVVLLETNDGRRHYKQALEVFKSGKRVFIDKPIAASLADAIRIVRAAKKYNAPFFSSSALRYVRNAQAARTKKFGDVLGADVYTPASLEATHSRFYWYGIHGAEPLYTIMGRGCRSVIGVGQENTDVLLGTWADGRIGVMRGMRGRGATYGGLIFTAKKSVVNMGSYEGYQPLLLEILSFFKTGVAPVDPEETLEIFAFMEAGAESIRRGGTAVTLDEVMKKAEKEVAAP